MNCVLNGVGSDSDTWVTPVLGNEPAFRTGDEICARVEGLELALFMVTMSSSFNNLHDSIGQ